MDKKKLVGDRLQMARQAHGLSLRALAEKLEISAQALSKYERGADMPGSTILLAMAKFFGVRVDYFCRANQVVMTDGPEFRAKNAFRIKQQNTLQARIQDWLERYEQAEALFPKEQPKISPLFENPAEITSDEEIEALALKVRKTWGLGTAPIPPKGLIPLLEDHGVRVYLIDAPDSFDAVKFKANGYPVIVAQKNVPGDRIRFDIAHELGHFLIRTPETGTKRERERPAMKFAGAFLVPATVVRQELGSTRSQITIEELAILKAKYGLSMGGWLFRAKILGIITEFQAVHYFRMFQKLGFRLKEPGDQYPPEESTRLERLVMRAHSESLISESRAAEILGVTINQLRKDRLCIDE